MNPVSCSSWTSDTEVLNKVPFCADHCKKKYISYEFSVDYVRAKAKANRVYTMNCKSVRLARAF